MAWLYQPSERRALHDVAKLAVTLRDGRVPGPFLDPGFDEVSLGTVGRVLLMAPAELGLDPSSPRRFALARGTERLCLAEILPGRAGEEEARLHVAAVQAAARLRGGAVEIVGWLIAEALDGRASELLRAAGALGTSTG